jgi:hypothetical protein
VTQIIILPNAERCPEGAVLEVEPGANLIEVVMTTSIRLAPGSTSNTAPSGHLSAFGNMIIWVTVNPFVRFQTLRSGGLTAPA